MKEGIQLIHIIGSSSSDPSEDSSAAGKTEVSAAPEDKLVDNDCTIV
jgi:hypothetical protein